MESEAARLRQEVVAAEESAAQREEAASRAAREKWEAEKSKLQERGPRVVHAGSAGRGRSWW